jgi:micrococcal nuclease
MNRNIKIFFLIFFGVLFILIGFLIFSNKNKIDQITSIVVTLPSSPPISTPSEEVTFAKVTRVIDGDTFVIDTGAHVRYIGMNAPEMSPLECYAKEATEIDKNLVLGKTVKLVKDVSETDKYDRLLRYVYVEDASVGDTFVDDELVKEGAAKIMTVPPDIEFKEEFQRSENYAKENKLGLWGKCN